jgi:DNA-binding response OmpR family regulator
LFLVHLGLSFGRLPCRSVSWSKSLPIGHATVSCLDTLRSYRRSGGTAPVIVLTGDDSAKVRRAAQRAGATAIVLKPFDMIDFLDRLEVLASTSHDPGPQIIDLTDVATVARPWYAS